MIFWDLLALAFAFGVGAVVFMLPILAAILIFDRLFDGGDK